MSRIVLALACASVLVVLAGLIALPPAELSSFQVDDAHYVYSIAENHAAGRGWTVDGESPTTGFHMLHAWSLSALAEVLPRETLPYVSTAIAFCLFLVSGFLLRRELGDFIAACWLLNPWCWRACALGLETGWTFLGAAICWPMVEADTLATAVLPLFRTDFIVLLPLALWRRRWRSAAGLIVGWVIIAVFCWHVTGRLIQDSGAMKQHWRICAWRIDETGWKPFWSGAVGQLLHNTGDPLRIAFGLHDLWVPRFAEQAIKVLALVMLVAFWRADCAQLVCWALACATMEAVGEYWYAISVLVVGYRLLARAPQWVLVPVLLAYLTAAYPIAHDAPWVHNIAFYRIAERLSPLVPAGRIGSWNGGVLGWASRRPVVNLDGLVNSQVLPAVRNGTFGMDIIDRRCDYVLDGGESPDRFSRYGYGPLPELKPLRLLYQSESDHPHGGWWAWQVVHSKQKPPER